MNNKCRQKDAPKTLPKVRYAFLRKQDYASFLLGFVCILLFTSCFDKSKQQASTPSSDSIAASKEKVQNTKEGAITGSPNTKSQKKQLRCAVLIRPQRIDYEIFALNNGEYRLQKSVKAFDPSLNQVNSKSNRNQEDYRRLVINKLIEVLTCEHYLRDKDIIFLIQEQDWAEESVEAYRCLITEKDFVPIKINNGTYAVQDYINNNSPRYSSNF